MLSQIVSIRGWDCAFLRAVLSGTGIFGFGERRMRLYLSTFTNKIDKKGRVSIPAPFRAVVTAVGPSTVVAFPSIGDHNCVNCCDTQYFEELAAGLGEFGPYTDVYDAFSTSILADSEVLKFETDGRFVLPPELIEYAGLAGEVTFAGQGKIFQIWNPEDYKTFRAQARKTAREKRDIFKMPGQGSGSGQGGA